MSIDTWAGFGPDGSSIKSLGLIMSAGFFFHVFVGKKKIKSVFKICSVHTHGLRTPNEGINQRYLKKNCVLHY